MSVDIVSILAGAKVPYRLAPHARVRTGWVGLDCPKCSPGHNKFRLGIHLQNGRCHCWVCGTLWAPKMVSQATGMPFGECIQLFKGVRQPYDREEQQEGRLVLPKGVGALLPIHERYLTGRGLDPLEMTARWGIQGTGPAVRLPWRLFIPIYEKMGRMVSWTTRTVGKDHHQRYHSATSEEEIIPHKSVLYGANLARHTVIVVEGPVDAWTIGPGTVATLGVGLSKIQLSLIAEYPVRIVCFDAEDDAQERAEALCNQLSLLPGQVENITLETGKDPSEAHPHEVWEIRRKFFPELYCT